MQPFHDLLSAFSQDVTTTRYATFDDVADYCTRSANPVGRLMLALYGLGTPANHRASDAICTGLQLANFWQDVADRLGEGPRLPADRGPAALRRQRGADRRGPRGPRRWRALMAFETARARACLDAGRPLLRELPWRLRLEIGAVIAGGRRILSRIDDVQGDVFRRRPVLGPLDWIAVALRTLVPARTGPVVRA